MKRIDVTKKYEKISRWVKNPRQQFIQVIRNHGNETLLFAFIEAYKNHNLQHLIQYFDWTLGKPVIDCGYYSPHPEMAYTFGMIDFEKHV